MPKPRLLNEWLDDSEFRSHYMAACQALRDQIDSALLQSGVRAAARLVRAINGETLESDVERRTLVDLVRIARAVLSRDPTEKERKLFADSKPRRHKYWPLHESHWDHPERIQYFKEYWGAVDDPVKMAKVNERYPKGMPLSIEQAPPPVGKWKPPVAQGPAEAPKE